MAVTTKTQERAMEDSASVQFALCTPKQNRRNSAPIIIRSPAVDFSRGEKHPNFMSLAAKFPESPSPESPISPLMSDKRITRPQLCRLNNVDDQRSPKSPNYRSPKSPNQGARSPNSNNYFKFPPYEKNERKPKMCQDAIDEYKVYESFTSNAPLMSPGGPASPAPMHSSRSRSSISSSGGGRTSSPNRTRGSISSTCTAQPISPTNVNYEGFRSRSDSCSASQPRSSISSSAPRSEFSSLLESSCDSPLTDSTRCRRSTSDLTDLAEECITEATNLTRPCSPRSRSGSVKGIYYANYY